MALREVEGPAGAPWERPVHGTVDRLVVESDVLAGNPLDDPARRPLYVYRPPGVEHDHPRPLPSVYVIQGYTGQLDMWFNRTWLEPTMVERLDAMFAAGECPDAIVVFVDAWTSLGGSQYLNSSSLGRYQDHLCDEIVALASHAGDALFEACYLPDFRTVARSLRDDFDSSYDVFFERLGATDHLTETLSKPLELYGYAAAYSPDPDNPGKALLPFEVATGRVIDDVWERWLEKDPVRMAASRADAVRSQRRIYLDAGRGDEYFLDLGARAFSAELDKLGVAHSLELFDGKHGGLTYRYPGAIRELVLALSA